MSEPMYWPTFNDKPTPKAVVIEGETVCEVYAPPGGGTVIVSYDIDSGARLWLIGLYEMRPRVDDAPQDVMTFDMPWTCKAVCYQHTPNSPKVTRAILAEDVGGSFADQLGRLIQDAQDLGKESPCPK